MKTEELLIIVTVKASVKVGVNWNRFLKRLRKNKILLALGNTSDLLKDGESRGSHVHVGRD